MSQIFHVTGPDKNGAVQFWFHCPGCKCAHAFTVPGWNFNGDLDRATFTPSLFCNPDDIDTRCHSYVTDGKIQFLVDCHHELRGQTVDLPAWEGFQSGDFDK